MSVLENTDASQIAAALLQARRAAGSPAMGMVLTLVIVVPEEDAEDALGRGTGGREGASRPGCSGSSWAPSAAAPTITAEIRTGHGIAGELALIRLSGEVTRHPESVVLPLLLPDSPVVVWWPTKAPDRPGRGPARTSSAPGASPTPPQVPTGRAKAMLAQCASYAPGNTDLAWTRITPWRALLAAALDQVDGKVTGISVTAERISPSADLLGAWLADRLRAR